MLKNTADCIDAGSLIIFAVNGSPPGGSVLGSIGDTRGSTWAGAPIQKSRPSGVAIASGEILADRDAGDAAHQLAHQPAECHRVIAVRGARLPPRRHAGEQACHRGPVGPAAHWHRRRERDRGEAGGMLHHHAHRDRGLAVGRELGPIESDRLVEVEQPARDQGVAASAVAPLVHENARHTVSRFHGTVCVAAKVSPTAPCLEHRRALKVMPIDAPISPRVLKLATKASNTERKAGAQ
jgi:hypothetical protein